ncbi:hypothetical protein [Planococcus sp. ISL-109]|uniref:hypothetical protein n=1 Tax=Planococcus sp. ISL-109 TaxID=2819166 RepID=UPI001BE8A5B6|nr:hypothetical protein [Planococcus sp. ISL-109]MBT2583808.1 hypothetical protein [Planococcus sp. ISL-109]
MMPQENITAIKRLGVQSGEVEIICLPQDPMVIIGFLDLDTGVDFTLENIELGEMCFIKESRMIGDVNLERIKTSEEADKATRLLTEEVEKMKPELITKAKAYAEEIRERAGIPVEVIEDIQGEPGVMTEHDQNMWRAGEVLRGIDDDY